MSTKAGKRRKYYKAFKFADGIQSFFFARTGRLQKRITLNGCRADAFGCNFWLKKVGPTTQLFGYTDHGCCFYKRFGRKRGKRLW